MHETYSDDFASIAVGDRDRLIPAGVRKLAGAVVFLGVVAAMGLWSYRLGTRDAAEVPVIRAMEGPARIQPEDPGGAQAAHQGLEVNTVLSGVPAPVARTPSATAVLPVVPALAEEDAPQGALIVAAARAFAEPADAAGDDLQMPLSEDGIETVVVEGAPDLGALVAETLAAEAGSETTGAEAGARPRSRPGNLQRVRAQAPTAMVAAAATPPVAAAATPPAAAATRPAAAPAREVASASSGSRMVQLGAYDSEQSTRQAWSQLVARHGDLFAGKSLYAERATSNSRVFYRLRVAGFSNTEQTRVMCEQLKARGIDCIPVTLQ
jgi:hypothetical protein